MQERKREGCTVGAGEKEGGVYCRCRRELGAGEKEGGVYCRCRRERGRGVL